MASWMGMGRLEEEALLLVGVEISDGLDVVIALRNVRMGVNTQGQPSLLGVLTNPVGGTCV